MSDSLRKHVFSSYNALKTLQTCVNLHIIHITYNTQYILDAETLKSLVRVLPSVVYANQTNVNSITLRKGP